MNDGVNTEPLDIVLYPWPNINLFNFDATHTMGMSYICDIERDIQHFPSALYMFEYVKALFLKRDDLARAILATSSQIQAVKLVALLRGWGWIGGIVLMRYSNRYYY